MNNIITCPKCKGKEGGCPYCEFNEFVIFEDGRYYTITLDEQNLPIKNKPLEQPMTSGQLGGGSIIGKFFFRPEPHDILWFFKDRIK